MEWWVKIIIGLVVICLLSLLTILLIKNRSTRRVRNVCSVNEECGPGMRCVPNPQENNEKQCIPEDRKWCSLSPTLLTSCVNDECEKCLNDPKFTCVEVTKDNPYKIKMKIGDELKDVDMPLGKWCLPNVVNRDVQCNPFTSDYILTEIEDGKYAWVCRCRYPNLFDHNSGPGSDCTLVRACGNLNKLGKLYVPTQTSCTDNEGCGEDEKCMSRLSPAPCGYNSSTAYQDGGDDCKLGKCVCHTEWKGDIQKEVNPLFGRCVCDRDRNLRYQCISRSSDYTEMNCVKGYCDGFTEGGKCNTDKCFKNQNGDCVCCECPPGTIRCPDDIITANRGLLNYCKTTGPTCVPDPCKTDEVPDGYFDPVKGHCVCPTPNETGMAVADENSAVGQVCRDLCKNNGPCSERGKCYLPKGSQRALCCDCVCPWTNDGDGSCTCSLRKLYTSIFDGKKYMVQIGGARCVDDNNCCSGWCKGSRKQENNGRWESVAQGTCTNSDGVITTNCDYKCTVNV